MGTSSTFGEQNIVDTLVAKGVVVVSINYRIDVMGRPGQGGPNTLFYTHRALSAHNDAPCV